MQRVVCIALWKSRLARCWLVLFLFDKSPEAVFSIAAERRARPECWGLQLPGPPAVAAANATPEPAKTSAARPVLLPARPSLQLHLEELRRGCGHQTRGLIGYPNPSRSTYGTGG